MKNNKLKLRGFAALMICALCLSACGKEQTDQVKWETQPIEQAGFTFEIPIDWQLVDPPNGSEGVIFMPESADEQLGTSNINLVVVESKKPAPTLKEMKAGYPQQFEKIMEDYAPGAADFFYSNFNSDIGTVFLASAKAKIDGRTVTVSVYSPLVDGYQINLISTDIGDRVKPSLLEVCQRICKTMEVT